MTRCLQALQVGGYNLLFVPSLKIHSRALEAMPTMDGTFYSQGLNFLLTLSGPLIDWLGVAAPTRNRLAWASNAAAILLKRSLFSSGGISLYN